MQIVAVLAGLLLACLPWPVAADTIDCTAAGALWSDSDPPIDLTHIFCGDVDRRDAALEGYHALAKSHSDGEAEIREIYDGPNADGVSRAVICLPGSKAAGVRRRCKCSSLFPGDWSVEQVTEAIQLALRDGRTDRRGFFRGPGGSGFAVEGWLVPAHRARAACGAERCVATAYPVFEDDDTGKAEPWFCPLSR